MSSNLNLSLVSRDSNYHKLNYSSHQPLSNSSPNVHIPTISNHLIFSRMSQLEQELERLYYLGLLEGALSLHSVFKHSPNLTELNSCPEFISCLVDYVADSLNSLESSLPLLWEDLTKLGEIQIVGAHAIAHIDSKFIKKLYQDAVTMHPRAAEIPSDLFLTQLRNCHEPQDIRIVYKEGTTWKETIKMNTPLIDTQPFDPKLNSIKPICLDEKKGYFEYPFANKCIRVGNTSKEIVFRKDDFTIVVDPSSVEIKNGLVNKDKLKFYIRSNNIYHAIYETAFNLQTLGPQDYNAKSVCEYLVNQMLGQTAPAPSTFAILLSTQLHHYLSTPTYEKKVSFDLRSALEAKFRYHPLLVTALLLMNEIAINRSETNFRPSSITFSCIWKNLATTTPHPLALLKQKDQLSAEFLSLPWMLSGLFFLNLQGPIKDDQIEPKSTLISCQQSHYMKIRLPIDATAYVLFPYNFTQLLSEFHIATELLLHDRNGTTTQVLLKEARKFLPKLTECDQNALKSGFIATAPYIDCEFDCTLPFLNSNNPFIQWGGAILQLSLLWQNHQIDTYNFFSHTIPLLMTSETPLLRETGLLLAQKVLRYPFSMPSKPLKTYAEALYFLLLKAVEAPDQEYIQWLLENVDVTYIIEIVIQKEYADDFFKICNWVYPNEPVQIINLVLHVFKYTYDPQLLSIACQIVINNFTEEDRKEYISQIAKIHAYIQLLVKKGTPTKNYLTNENISQLEAIFKTHLEKVEKNTNSITNSLIKLRSKSILSKPEEDQLWDQLQKQIDEKERSDEPWYNHKLGEEFFDIFQDIPNSHVLKKQSARIILKNYLKVLNRKGISYILILECLLGGKLDAEDVKLFIMSLKPLQPMYINRHSPFLQQIKTALPELIALSEADPICLVHLFTYLTPLKGVLDQSNLPNLVQKVVALLPTQTIETKKIICNTVSTCMNNLERSYLQTIALKMIEFISETNRLNRWLKYLPTKYQEHEIPLVLKKMIRALKNRNLNKSSVQMIYATIYPILKKNPQHSFFSPSIVESLVKSFRGTCTNLQILELIDLVGCQSQTLFNIKLEIFIEKLNKGEELESFANDFISLISDSTFTFEKKYKDAIIPNLFEKLLLKAKEDLSDTKFLFLALKTSTFTKSIYFNSSLKDALLVILDHFKCDEPIQKTIVDALISRFFKNAENIRKENAALIKIFLPFIKEKTFLTIVWKQLVNQFLQDPLLKEFYEVQGAHPPTINWCDLDIQTLIKALETMPSSWVNELTANVDVLNLMSIPPIMPILETLKGFNKNFLDCRTYV